MPRCRVGVQNLLKRYAPRGIRNQGTPLERLLGEWDRNRRAMGYFPGSEMFMLLVIHHYIGARPPRLIFFPHSLRTSRAHPTLETTDWGWSVQPRVQLYSLLTLTRPVGTVCRSTAGSRTAGVRHQTCRDSVQVYSRQSHCGGAETLVTAACSQHRCSRGLAPSLGVLRAGWLCYRLQVTASMPILGTGITAGHVTWRRQQR
jgi:hypothetical protein